MVKLLSAAAALLAAASSVAASAQWDPQWNISNWEAGCARSGCFYNFNVTGRPDDVVPSFAAYCNGYEYRTNVTYFQPCAIYDKGEGNRGVSARFIPRKGNGILEKVAISFAYTNLTTGTVRNFTGEANITMNQFVAPPQNYSITNIWENGLL
ncbi:hypothetical protein E6O75_ATG07342 [Venturia nashicola]|uniref:Uncharacterized protein n=1 Tax=Venturia nashicola TaxID=86259 RepID=A0A4Z1NJY3_9PEZI|nr:hypothetical protein E6O75_ATG07342 [Venturia nashicola]